MSAYEPVYPEIPTTAMDLVAIVNGDGGQATPRQAVERFYALMAELDAAKAKADVIGGDFCREARAAGRNLCGACVLCVADRDATIAAWRPLVRACCDLEAGKAFGTGFIVAAVKALPPEARP